MDAGRHTLVLVVDDNAENRALARATLEDEGYRVVLASSGAEGVEAFVEHQPDCVLLDVQMPGMDGITACGLIREAPGGRDVPIVFVTAQRDVETFDRARLAGGDDFLTKPVRPTELVLRMQVAMKLHRIAAERNELFDLMRRQRDDVMRLQLQREQLIAFLVHDLKNPVHAIKLHGELIARDQQASPRSRASAASIQSDTGALLRMIMNLLDLSKADEGRLVPASQPIELSGLAAEVKTAMAARARTADVDLVADVPSRTIHGDPDLIRRMLENLVDNAIRHAPERSAVRVSAADQGPHVEIRVADAGPGVPPALRERVFDRFVQGEAASRAGRGLGLAFCKLAVEAHGGAIWIEDAQPGAVFCVRLAARPSPADAS
ncbi:MAG TPA: hybrid sensor histidine kinase/response regulator [Kofleriaceae bacterium]|nr:hybrid sensor histidine kinase/response regulator [Kofleriaceae bacterium]